MHQYDVQCKSVQVHTVSQFLRHLVRTAFDSADSLIVEHDHLTTHGHRAARERQERHIHVVLPEVAYQIHFVQHGQRLQRRLRLRICGLKLRLCADKMEDLVLGMLS